MSFSPSFPTSETHPQHHRIGSFKNRDRFQAQELKKRRLEQSQNLRRLKREEALQRTRNIIRNNLPADDNDINGNNSDGIAETHCDLSQDRTTISPASLDNGSHSDSISTASLNSTNSVASSLNTGSYQSNKFSTGQATSSIKFNNYVSNSNSVSSSVVSVSTITGLLKFLRRDETSQQIYALRSLRRLLVSQSDNDTNSPNNGSSNLIEIIFSLNLIPDVIALLRSPYPSIRIEACWVLTTISTAQSVDSHELSDYINRIIHMGAIDAMLDLLRLSIWELQNFDGRNYNPAANVSNEVNQMLISQELGLWALGTFLTEYENSLMAGSTPISPSQLSARYAPEILPIIKSLVISNFSAVSPSRLSTMGVNGENLQSRVAVKLSWLISIIFRDTAASTMTPAVSPSALGFKLDSPLNSPSTSSYFSSSGITDSLDILMRLLVDHLKNNKIISDICWSLAYISDANSNYLSPLFDMQVSTLLFGILASSPPSGETIGVYNSQIKLPILKTLGNICTGDLAMTRLIISTPGALSIISSLIAAENSSNIEPDHNILKECCWIISNIVSVISGSALPAEDETAYISLMTQAGVLNNLSATVTMISVRGLCGDFADDASSSTDKSFVQGVAYRLILKECCFTICNFLNGVLNGTQDTSAFEHALAQVDATAFNYIFNMVLTDDIPLVLTVLETIKSVLHVNRMLSAGTQQSTGLESFIKDLIQSIKQNQPILTRLEALYNETNDGVNSLSGEINSAAFSQQQQVHQLCVIIKDYLV